MFVSSLILQAMILLIIGLFLGHLGRKLPKVSGGFDFAIMFLICSGGILGYQSTRTLWERWVTVFPPAVYGGWLLWGLGIFAGAVSMAKLCRWLIDPAPSAGSDGPVK